MPAQDGVRLDEHQSRTPAAPGRGQQDPQQPVTVAEARPFEGALQRPQLMPKGDVFEDDFLMPTAGHGDRPQQQQDQFEHA